MSSCVEISAQDEVGYDNLQELCEGSDESLQISYEQLENLSQNHIKVNMATADDLMQIPFLSEGQIRDILEYRKQYGPLRSGGELAMIQSIDNRVRDLLASVLSYESDDVGPWYKKAVFTRALHNIKNKIILTGQIPTYYRAGDQGAPEEKPDGKKNSYAGRYLGDRYAYSLRYTLSIGKDIQLNFTGDKSAGEPFFRNGNNWGFDDYACNLSFTNTGIFTHIICGKFKGKFGMGLVLNNNFSLGKEAMINGVGRRASYFNAHNSASDSKHFQGIAATAMLAKNIVMASFVSYRYIDASLNKDSTISTVLTSNYHRTPTEMGKKNNSTQFTAGTHVAWENLHYGIGLSALYTAYNRDLNPTYSSGTSVNYRTYYPHGNHFWNLGIDYHFSWQKLSLTGETATGDCKNVATVNSLSFGIGKVTLMAVQRYYAYQYNAIYGSSFGETSRVQNESGVYLGAMWNPKSYLTFSVYTDISYSPWLKYLVSNSSYIWDNCLKAEWKVGSTCTLAMRYRAKISQRDQKQSDDSKALANKLDQKLRFVFTYKTDHWNLKTQLEGCTVAYDNNTKGGIVSQSATWKPSRSLSLSASASYFNTEDYNTRLYVYESSPLYSFGYSSFYGHGYRASFMARYQIVRWCTLLAKIGHSQYFDRSTIGTADRIVFSNKLTDVNVQLQIKL